MAEGCSAGNSRTKYKNLSAACKTMEHLSYGTNETRGTHALSIFLVTFRECQLRVEQLLNFTFVFAIYFLYGRDPCSRGGQLS